MATQDVQTGMRRLSLHALIIAGYTLLTFVLTYPMILYLTTHIPFNPYISTDFNSKKELIPGVGDHWYFMWALGFIEHLLVGSRRWSLFTDAIFYPRGVDLTYHTLLGFGVPLAVSIPFVHFLGVILTYNLFTICSFILTAYSTFLLVRYLIKDSRAAFVSGVIFAFSPYHMARSLGHFNFTTSGMWVPLYIFFFIRSVTDGRVMDLILAPLLLTLTMISNPYYAVVLGIFTIIYVLYHLLPRRSPVVNILLLKRILAIGLIASPMFLSLAWVILIHGRRDVHIYKWLSDSIHSGADLLAFFIPSIYHPLWGGLVKPIYDLFANNYTEETVYIGYTVLALSLVAVLNAPRAKTRFWAVSALAFFVLSLGPFLHINGKAIFTLGEMPITFPLPDLLLYFVPGLRAARVASRFSIMLMLALVVLAGYGTRHLLKQRQGGADAALLSLGIIVMIIVFEFVSSPLPIIDARIPKVYERIAKDGGQGGTLLDVPLDWRIFKYAYYQTAHQKRLLIGAAPRLSLALVTHYADSIPFIRLFKNPELIAEYEQRPVLRRDVLRFIEFFDLGFIVLHKDYLESEVFDRLMRFLLAHFPIMHMANEGNIVALQLARDDKSADLWMGPDGYLLDFGSTAPQFFLFEGWSSPERLGERTFAWADAKESRLWVFLPRREDLLLELGLLPLTFPGSPPQGIKISVNERFVREIQLEAASDWESYTVHLPRTYLTVGVNTIRFVYRYMASPSKVVPGNPDLRRLAVAFDFIAFRPE